MASYLLNEGFPLIGREIEGGKGIFAFEDTPDLHERVTEFYSPTCDARRLFESFRSVKNFLFDNR